MLRISDGVNAPVTISDNGVGDTSATLGQVNYANSSYFGWNVLVTSGITKPVVGSATAPALDISFQLVRGANSQGTISIYFSENGFNLASPVNFGTDAGGVLGNLGSPSANVRTYYDLGNTELLTTSSLTSHLFSGQGAFSGSDAGGPVGPDSSVSFTIRLDVSTPIGAVSSGDIDLHSTTNVPESGSMATLLGASLLALGLWRLRSQKARA